MFWLRDRFLLVPHEPAKETDLSVCRNHAVLPMMEGPFCDGARRGESLFRLTHARRIPSLGRNKNRRIGRVEMEILYARCAGVDVHKKTVKVCLLIRQENGQPHKEFRTYGTTTQELLELADWLHEQGCTHVAMEATGVYWKPVYNLLEGGFELRARQCAAYQSGGRRAKRIPKTRSGLLTYSSMACSKRASFLPLRRENYEN